MARGEGKITDNSLHKSLTDELDSKVNITDFNARISDSNFQTATGTSNAITLSLGTLVNGYSKTFIASSNNNGNGTTINGKPLYKPNTTTAPSLTAGKAYTIWYNSTSNCFFIKASAEGNVIASHVLAGDTCSNDSDVGLVGTMPNNGLVGGTITTQGGSINIPAGYTSGGVVNTNISNLTPENIKSGVNVGGVIGTLLSATLKASDTLIFTDNQTYVPYSVTISNKIYIKVNGVIRTRVTVGIDPNNSLASGTCFWLKNGSQVGITRNPAYATNIGGVVYAEDFSCSAGDYFQFCYKPIVSYGVVSNIKIYGDIDATLVSF